MQEPEDVVEAVVDHRVARVRGVRHDVERLRDRQVRLHERDLTARAHDLAQRAVACSEDVVEDASLHVLEAAVARDDPAELLLAHLLVARRRVAAQKLDDDVGRAGQRPHRRAHEPREPVEGWRDEGRELLRALQRNALGHELAQDEREVRDDERERDERRRLRCSLGQACAHEERGDVRRERRGAERRREEPGDGHADLHRREEPVRVTRQLRRAGLAPALLGHAVHLGLAQRDESHLRAGEDTADEDEHQDEAGRDKSVLVHQTHPRRHSLGSRSSVLQLSSM